MRSLFISFVFIFQLTTCAQTDTSERLFTPAIAEYLFTLGDTTFTIRVSVYDSASRLVFVHLHDDELTAKEATHSFLERNGGTLVSIPNSCQRLITFPKDGKYFTFDPNRMFTRKGIIESLKLFQPYNKSAATEIERFAASYLRLIPDSSMVTAVHNNTPDRYSILTYLSKGGLAGEATKVHTNREMDPDDFVLTTDPRIFTRLQEQNFNVVLQKNNPPTDDGSLSILFGRKRRTYINVEAEHGHYEVQLRLLQLVADITSEL